MVKRVLLSSFLIIISLSASAQVDSTYMFDQVDIVEYRVDSKSGVGTMVTDVDERAIARSRTRTLSELLNDNSGINIKSMGQGALSTASFRGTSSNHTQILWNGISLNSTTLGSFDLSQIPIYFIDNVTLYHGSAAQQSGSGALGGSINFYSDDRSIEGTELSVLGEYGSNNTVVGGVTLRATKGRTTLLTRGYYQQSDNDYRYLNNVYSSVATYENREDADYSQAGFMQELHHRSDRGDRLKAVVWAQYDDRSIPQSIISSTTASEQTTSLSVRGVVSYEMVRHNHRYKYTLANLWSNYDYAKESGSFLTESNNRSNSVIAQGDYSYKIGQNIEVGSTLRYRNDLAESASLEGGRSIRNTLSARMYGVFKPFKRLHFDVDGTLESMDSDVYAIYNVSARYIVVSNLLTLKMSQAYNYRMPTLNDLYWSPGGNPDLLPERGFSWDMSAVFSPKLGAVDMEFEASYYNMNIEDWIMWVPTDNGYIWSPVNYSNVLSRGAEVNGRLSAKYGDVRHSLRASYTYAHTVDRTNSGSDSYGRQLPYIPRNKWSATYEVWWRDILWFNYNVNFTDVRYTTSDEEYYTDAYTIHNAEIGGVIKCKGVEKLKLSLRVDNLFDSYYESTHYYPMPLRMFRLQCNYLF